MAVTFLGLGFMSLIEFHGSLDVVALDKSRVLRSQSGAALQTSIAFDASSDWRTPRPSRGQARRFAATIALAAGRRPRLTASDRRNWRLTPSADDCAVSLTYQVIDQWRWGLSLNEVRFTAAIGTSASANVARRNSEGPARPNACRAKLFRHASNRCA